MLRSDILRESDRVDWDAGGSYEAAEARFGADFEEDQAIGQDQVAVAVLHPRTAGHDAASCAEFRVDLWQSSPTSPEVLMHYTPLASHTMDTEVIRRDGEIVIHFDGDLSLSAETCTNHTLARFPALPPRPSDRIDEDDGDGFGGDHRITGILLQVPISRNASGVIGRRMSLINRSTGRVLSEGVIGRW